MHLEIFVLLILLKDYKNYGKVENFERFKKKTLSYSIFGWSPEITLN